MKPDRLKIKRVYQWQYRPGDPDGVLHFFGWRLVLVGFRYFKNRQEVTL